MTLLRPGDELPEEEEEEEEEDDDEPEAEGKADTPTTFAGRIKKLYIGRAGEHLVISRLLRFGYNCATLPIDAGIDILAHHELYAESPLNDKSSETLEQELQQWQSSPASVPVILESPVVPDKIQLELKSAGRALPVFQLASV